MFVFSSESRHDVVRPRHASRILELLRLTDPDSQGPRPPGRSLEDEGGVSAEAIEQLEDRVKVAEVRPRETRTAVVTEYSNIFQH